MWGEDPGPKSLRSQSLRGPRNPTANCGDSVGSGLGGGARTAVICVLPDSPASPQQS